MQPGAPAPVTPPEPATPVPEPVPVTPAPQEPRKDVSATVEKPDLSTIIITYRGGRDSDQLMELETIVTDDHGTVRVQGMGSRLGTTPAQNGGSVTFYGPFTQKTHVVATGHFADGSHQDVLDTWI